MAHSVSAPPGGAAEAHPEPAQELAVLFVFPPLLNTSALVAARRIRERGVRTDVIARRPEDEEDSDALSLEVLEGHVGTVRYLPGLDPRPTWSTVVAFTEAVVAERDRLVAARRLAGHPDYAGLYSRAMEVPSHFAAALLKLRHPALRWRAELSDPLLVNPYGERRVAELEGDALTEELAAGMRAAGFEPPASRSLFEWAEHLVYALADEVVFTNDNQRELMLGYCADAALAERARTLSRVEAHPTLPQRFYRLRHAGLRLRHDRVHVGYFGVFYRTRGLTEVLDALAALTAPEQDRLRLHVYTDRPARLRRQVEAAGLGATVRVRRFVPFLEFLNLTLRFDALLVNDAATAGVLPLNPYLPSKLSDYLGSGSPIWALVEPGSVLSRTPTAYRSELGDVDGALRVLRELLAAPRQSGGSDAPAATDPPD